MSVGHKVCMFKVEASVLALPQDTTTHDKSDGVTKIMQTELSLAFCVEVDGRLKLYEIPIVCPLQAVDANNTRTIFAAFTESLRVPGLEQLWAIFPHRFFACTLDGAGQNESAYQALRQNSFSSSVGFRNACDAHRISTVTSRAYGIVEGCISGVLATALCMRTGGFFASFRRTMQDIIAASVTVVDACPPRANDPQIVRRNELLELCLPKTPQARLSCLISGCSVVESVSKVSCCK
jgi:hypothetical protein